MINSAVLLAAGRGKRQRPFTDVTPKPLLQTDGRATLDYVLIAVARAGVERICLVTHYLEEKIRDYVGDGSRWKLNVIFAHQARLRGSGDRVGQLFCEPVHDVIHSCSSSRAAGPGSGAVSRSEPARTGEVRQGSGAKLVHM